MKKILNVGIKLHLHLVTSLIAFHPKALINMIEAGLLTYSTFNAFPLYITVALNVKSLRSLQLRV